VNVRLGDIDVGYTTVGEGPPVVLIHGLAEDRTSWARVQETLGGYRSHAYDLRGHGETTLGDANGTLAQLGGDLARFLETVAGPATCVGYSLGGTIALWTAAEHPALVRNVVVAGTSSVVGHKAAQFFEERIRIIQEDFSAFARELRGDTARQLVVAVNELDAVASRRMAAVCDGRGYVNAARAMKRLAKEPLTPLLRRITCRVDVIGGEKDVFCPRRAAEMLINDLSNAKYHEIEGAGHLMSIDKPAAYAGAIKLSLERSISA
jgi:pimeloyl-ACP methyl ester carboxylesterase